MCTEQKVTVSEPVMDGRLPRTMSKIIHHVPLLVESALNELTKGSGSKVSLLSKIARSVLSVKAIIDRRCAEHDRWLPVE